MSSDNSSNLSAVPTYLDVAIAARSLIIQRDVWQEKWIGTEPHYVPDMALNSKDAQTFAGWQKEQNQLRPITEERTDKAIQRLPEQHRQTAKEDVQKILSGGHDMELNRAENGVPVWSQWANSPLGQELLNEAQARTQAHVTVLQESPNEDARRAELLATLNAMQSYVDRIPGVEPEPTRTSELKKEFTENKQDITTPKRHSIEPPEPDDPDH